MTVSNFCSQCGSKLEEDANFCTQCGAKVGEVSPPKGYFTGEVLALANDVLLVREAGPDLIKFMSNSESKWILGKIKVKFEGRAKLNREKKEVTYWDQIKKTSSGFGGEEMGFGKESFVLKGIERSGSGEGFLPSGDKYSYDFGKVRELVRSFTERQGWKFKTTLFKPK